jgi:hypothetical protein
MLFRCYVNAAARELGQTGNSNKPVWQHFILLLLLSGSVLLSLVGCRQLDQQGRQAPPTSATPAPATSGTQPANELTELGKGQGIVFSPDLAARGNRRFYERLGFAYWEGADWAEVLASIRQHNQAHPDRQVRQIFLETHGSNGHGLKLQQSLNPAAARSYISLGALQEQLAQTGVQRLVLTACNTGAALPSQDLSCVTARFPGFDCLARYARCPQCLSRFCFRAKPACVFTPPGEPHRAD